MYDEFDFDQQGNPASTLWWERLLAGEYEASPTRIDYSVLSVYVITLGLIMVVEVVRHRIDHSAEGKPFFKAVLEGVYAELSTLGIVELFIWIFKSYYEDLDKKKYEVFAKVHFALFYTAIFNAFQSVIVAFFATRLSRRLWVRTEQLEVNHYVEIREEFQRVKEGIARLEKRSRGDDEDEKAPNGDQNGGAAASSGRATVSSESRSIWQSIYYDPTETQVESHRRRFRRFCRTMLDSVRYPKLRWKYNELLVQVRFHELRVHILQAYKLPLKLEISDYLMRSELNVLIKLVHVSMIAWLLLTGVSNLLYFLMGIVAYKTGNGELVGSALIWVFFGSITLFVVAALVLEEKMKKIFKTLMHQKLLWDVQQDDDEKKRLADQQLDLFWLGDPTVVIAAIQGMQFGYALALSCLIVFWDTINENHIMGMEWFLITLAIAYAFFVYVVARVIPRYTLCTSLGQLVDEHILHETVSAYHLEEARREHMQQMDVAQNDDVAFDEYSIAMESVDLVSPPQPPKSIGSSAQGGGTQTTTASQSGDSLTRDPAELMAELVKLDTESLRVNLPESEREELARRDELAKRAERRRRMRRKSISDGVAAMAKLGISLPDRQDKLSVRVRDDSDLTIMAAVRDKRLTIREESESASAADPVVPAPNVEEKLKPDDTTPEKLRARRPRRRQKSVSDGVALMSSLMSADLFAAIPKAVPEDKALESSMLSTAATGGENSELPSILSNSSADVSDSLRLAVQEADQTLHLSREGFLASADKNVEASTKAASNGMNGVGGQPREIMEATTSSQISLTSNHTNRSVGGHSDINDVPCITDSFLQQHHQCHKRKPRPSLRQMFRAYFLSRRFVLVSNVFGTMIAFFMIGQRVEGFLIGEEVVDTKEFVSFNFSIEVVFWILFFWLMCFVVSTLVVFACLGPPNKFTTVRERNVFLATVLDFVISGACFAFLIVGEVQRCCDDGTSGASNTAYDEPYHRYLAEETGSSDYYKVQTLPPCSCPRFGSRRHGGYGMIEPFTSFIAFRVIRFWVARKSVRLLASFSTPLPDESVMMKEPSGMQTDPFAVFSGVGHHDDHDGMLDDRGTISELWETAVAKYPEVVAEYGEFSGELLRAMLGLPVLAESRPPNDSGEAPPSADPLLKAKSYHLSNQFAGLPEHAQEIILAGKLGQPVKRVHSAGNTCPPPTITATAGDGPLSRSVVRRSRHLAFAIDKSQPKPSYENSILAFPNARLVRSMRRCDRKLLPILEMWSVVDVVVTRFEMVYFDATNVDRDDLDEETESTRQAVIATKGGKGLRLCDVAVGRRVVGHLLLTQVESIHVERTMPHERKSDEKKEGPAITVTKPEYWCTVAGHRTADRGLVWTTIKQDVLKIQTVMGRTFYLRFYTDLEDALSHPERLDMDNEVDGELHKNNAFHWVQTIARFCGPEQLNKQLLLHFGDDTADELRDFLIVKADESHQRETRHRHRRTASRDQLARFVPKLRKSMNLEAEAADLETGVGITSNPSPEGGGMKRVESAAVMQSQSSHLGLSAKARRGFNHRAHTFHGSEAKKGGAAVGDSNRPSSDRDPDEIAEDDEFFGGTGHVSAGESPSFY